MKNITAIFISLLICLFLAVPCFAATYYVDATGGNDASADPTNIATPWQTIAKVNDYAEATGFANGDEILFKKGETWSGDETLGDDGMPSSPTPIEWGTITGLTFGAYGSGDRPHFDGDNQMPIRIDGNAGGGQITNLTIKNIDISGQEWQAAKSFILYIRDTAGVVLDDIYGDGYNGNATEDATQAGKNAIAIIACSGTVEVKNCTLFNWGPNGIPANTIDLIGVYIGQPVSGTVNIHDNTIHDVEADALQFEHGDDSTTFNIYDNILYNSGEDDIDNKGVQNLNIYRNTMYRDDDFTGQGGSGTSRNHVNIHWQDAYIADDINIYHNEIGPSDSKAVKLAGSASYTVDGVIIRQNWITGTAQGVYLRNHVHDAWIYSNIFRNIEGRDFDIDNSVNSKTFIVNNTFVKEDGSGDYEIIYQLYPNIITITNNIFYQGEADYCLQVSANAVNTYNCYYRTDAGTTLSGVSAGTGDVDGSDPLLWSVANDQYWLQGASPCHNTGVDAGDNFDDVLASSSSWTSAVATVDADVYDWNIGAFEDDKIRDFSPTDTATGISVTADLTWTNPTGAVTVNVYFDKGAVPATTQVATGSLDTSYDPGTMDIGSEYHWRVDVVHAGGTETGEDYEFTTAGGPPPLPSYVGTIEYSSNAGDIVYDDAGMAIK